MHFCPWQEINTGRSSEEETLRAESPSQASEMLPLQAATLHLFNHWRKNNNKTMTLFSWAVTLFQNNLYYKLQLKVLKLMAIILEAN